MNDANESTNPVGEGGKVAKLEMLPSENTPAVYANAIQVAMGLYDVTLTFGLSEPHPNEDTLKVKPVVRISMSPQLAKATAALLSDKVGVYEKEFGPLPDVTKSFI